ncbi:MAG: hypothetical protein ACLR23_02320 [Clostridia bacterium]
MLGLWNFPEEGKYHYDGHRNCHVCLKPSDAEAVSGLCPVCGKKMTIGVDHRVEQLADRPEGYRPPLPAIIRVWSLCRKSSEPPPGSQAPAKVLAQYETMLRDIGPEFYDLCGRLPLKQSFQLRGPSVEEGIRRLRDGRVEAGHPATTGNTAPSNFSSQSGN